VWLVTGLKGLWGAYWTLTSLYCLLAYMPYTYCALIKAPPYSWMVGFVHHHVALYWVALLAAGIAFWPGRKTVWFCALFGAQTAFGAYLTLRPFMSTLQNDLSAYAWSLVALLLLILVTAIDQLRAGDEPRTGPDPAFLLDYSSAVLAAVIVTLLYALGAHVRHRIELHSWSIHLGDLELTLWSALSHVTVAILIVTILNAVCLVSRKTSRPHLLRTLLLELLIFSALWLALARFLDSTASFQGWLAQLYAALLAAALTLLGSSLLFPLLSAHRRSGPGNKSALVGTAFGAAIAAVMLPSVIGDGDWNGVLQSSFALLFWGFLGVCVYRFRPRLGRYSAVTLVAIVLLTLVIYKGALASSILWAKPLGHTDDDIARKMENYATQDVSFELAHHLLGNGRAEPCGDLCRILREHTNIRNAQAIRNLDLVEDLAPTSGERANIFIFVIDSLRPDYLGAYNPRVDFTPNLDALAQDSVVLRNAYTQYAGTTLSEPAIWSGALLLHAHYLQPFSKVNSLERLAKADGYQIMVSYDTILPNLLSPSDDLVKLDTDKLWNEYEICSTIEQTEHVLDSRPDKSRPVLFYAQPMNVHQFARNNWPTATAAHWPSRPDFVSRIAYEVHQVDTCMGRFVAYLKTTGLYDRSILVLTADHGDATGEFGRHSHSLWIYPEIMKVPLIIHLPKDMRGKFVHDDSRISTLTDVTPSLYYLLGHRPIIANPLFGHPLFTGTQQELDSYQRDDVFLASDARAVYGFLSDNGRYLYATYDSPPASFLFDLQQDPNAQRSILTDALKKQYDQRIIGQLQQIANYYGFKPGVGSLLTVSHTSGMQKGYIRVRASDGFMHDIPAADLEAARQKDRGLTVVSE
jgi:glucan phosphoethanolaminetransferase (alkaline phosphatase superfamily)